MWILETAPESETGTLSFRVLAGETKTIGRASGADFILDASLVSRVHCRLTAKATALEIVDLDSTNGTFVNDRRIRTAALASGDRLGIGRVTLVVSQLEQAPEAS